MTTDDALSPDSILNSVETAVFAMNRLGEIVAYSPKLERYFGPRPANVEALESAVDFSRSRTGAAVATDELPWRQALKSGGPAGCRALVRGQLTTKSLLVAITSRPASFNDSTLIVTTVRRIGNTRRLRAALKRQRERNEALFKNNQAAIVQTSIDGRVLACNRAFVRMLGYGSEAEVKATPVAKFYRGRRDGIVKRLLNEGVLRDCELEFVRKEGTFGVAVGTMQVVSQAEAEPTFLSTLVDISERREAESARDLTEKRFTEFVRHFPGVAFIKDANGTYLFVSGSGYALPELDPGRFIGSKDTEMLSEEQSRTVREHDLEVIRTGKGHRYSEDFEQRDGVHNWTVFKFPIAGETGEILIGGVAVDETDRRQLELRLQQAEKMEAIGRLAGGVAHDFNNLLTVISGYGQMLRDSLAKRQSYDKLETYLKEMLDASSRAGRLTDQLLAFARRRALKRQKIDLRDQVTEMHGILHRLIGEHIHLQIDVASEPCWIDADPDQMSQVLLNLAANARDAMPGGGTLQISAKPVSSAPDRADRPMILLEVSDSGNGMDAATRLRIFEPFFTSKPKGKGTGLGLSTVYGIVRQSGGEIMVASEPGSGSSFRIYFPVSTEKQSAPVKSADLAAGGATGAETILVVEDDSTVRKLVQAMLERFGYRVLVAPGPVEAIQLFRRHSSDVQLLLTDVVMPQMNGATLASELVKHAAGLKVLFMSGYTPDDIATRGVSQESPNLIRKPFQAEELNRQVRRVLDSAMQHRG